MILNGINLVDLCVESDAHGWFAEFELEYDGQLYNGQTVTVSDYSNYLLGHVVRYDTESCRGLAKAGSSSLDDAIGPIWIDAPIDSAMGALGVLGLAIDKSLRVKMYLPRQSRLEQIKYICQTHGLNWRIDSAGAVRIGDLSPDTVSPELIYEINATNGTVKIRGLAVLPFFISEISGAPVSAKFSFNDDYTIVDYSTESDPLAPVLRAIDRSTLQTSLITATVTAQSGSTCSVRIGETVCVGIPIAWGIAGMVCDIVPGATVLIGLVDGLPTVIGYPASSITGIQIQGGTDYLALSAPIVQWMTSMSSAFNSLVNTYNAHTNGGYPVAVAATVTAPPAPTVKSIVRSI
jgi:hypothetical protein